MHLVTKPSAELTHRNNSFGQSNVVKVSRGGVSTPSLLTARFFIVIWVTTVAEFTRDDYAADRRNSTQLKYLEALNRRKVF